MSFLHSPDGPVYNVHPTQLYASLMGFVMFGILLALSRHDSLKRAGRLFMLLLMLEGIERFVMEIYRFQPVPNQQLSPAQFVSVLLFVIGLVGFFTLPKKPAVNPAPVPNDYDRKPSTATAG